MTGLRAPLARPLTTYSTATFRRASSPVTRLMLYLSFPKIISGRSDDAIRLGLVWRRWSRIGSCRRLHLRHRLPHTQMFRDELGPHEHAGLLAARGTWLLAVVLAAVRRMMTAH